MRNGVVLTALTICVLLLAAAPAAFAEAQGANSEQAVTGSQATQNQQKQQIFPLPLALAAVGSLLAKAHSPLRINARIIDEKPAAPAPAEVQKDQEQIVMSSEEVVQADTVASEPAMTVDGSQQYVQYAPAGKAAPVVWVPAPTSTAAAVVPDSNVVQVVPGQVISDGTVYQMPQPGPAMTAPTYTGTVATGTVVTTPAQQTLVSSQVIDTFNQTSSMDLNSTTSTPVYTPPQQQQQVWTVPQQQQQVWVATPTTYAPPVQAYYPSQTVTKAHGQVVMVPYQSSMTVSPRSSVWTGKSSSGYKMTGPVITSSQPVMGHMVKGATLMPQQQTWGYMHGSKGMTTVSVTPRHQGYMAPMQGDMNMTTMPASMGPSSSSMPTGPSSSSGADGTMPAPVPYQPAQAPTADQQPPTIIVINEGQGDDGMPMQQPSNPTGMPVNPNAGPRMAGQPGPGVGNRRAPAMIPMNHQQGSGMGGFGPSGGMEAGAVGSMASGPLTRVALKTLPQHTTHKAPH